IAGIAYLRVDGDQYPLRGNFTVSPSAVARQGIAGQDYVHGYQEMPRVPFIEGDVSLIPELSLEDIEAVTDATVQADLANGRSYVLRGAWCVSALEANTGEGQVKVRFEGLSCDEVGG
ncbi:phage tail tube protein, partial [Rhodoplanes roseus]